MERLLIEIWKLYMYSEILPTLRAATSILATSVLVTYTISVLKWFNVDVTSLLSESQEPKLQS